MLTHKILALAGAVTLFAFAGGTAALAEDCYADWGTAGEIVRREKLVTVQQLTQGYAAGIPGTIVKTTLCKDGDDFIYKLVVRDPSGQLKTVVVDARNPGQGAGGAGAGGASSSGLTVKAR